MNEYLIRAKHWQIFLSVVLPIVLISSIPEFDFMVLKLKRIIIFTYYWLWVLILGESIHECTPRRVSINNNLFKINVAFLIFVHGIAIALMDPNVIYIFSGYWILIILYLVVAVIQINYHLGKLLVSTEEKKWVPLKNHFKESSLFFLGILGIYWHQPRLNKIAEQCYEDEEL